jgi:RNA polymerase sigma-70 factor (ECF subfamily)
MKGSSPPRPYSEDALAHADPSLPVGVAPSAPPTLAELYDAYAAAVTRWAGRLAGPGFDIEDIVHDAFLVVNRELPRFRERGQTASWLYRITANVVRHRRRKERMRRWLRGSAGDFADQIATRVPTPVEQLERREDARAVYQVLDRMREPYRTVLILFELEELSGEEIARLTEIKLATVWVRLHRARNMFLSLIKAPGCLTGRRTDPMEDR